MKYQNTKHKIQINNKEENFKSKTNRSIDIKTQNIKYKFQINNIDQNYKFKTTQGIAGLSFRYCFLEFICFLGFVVCNFIVFGICCL